MKTKFQIPNSKFYSRKARKGFTLIELLVVLGITVVLAVVGTVSYNGAIKRDQLDSYSKEIISSLEKARTKAINQEEGDYWGVRFEANISSAFSNYAIFKGESSGTDFIDVKTLNTSVNFTSPNPSGAIPIEEIVFNKSTGTIKDGINHLIQISSGSLTKDIYINKNGLISLGLPSSVDVLPAPTLTSPSDGTIIGIVTSQNLVWGAVAGAQTYRLQVSTDINFGSLFFDDSTLTSASYTITGLQAYTVYYWRVNAYSLLTGSSLWSSIRSFGTLTSPSAPVSPSGAPANGSNILTWSAPTTNGGSAVTGYKIYWGTSSDSLINSEIVGNVLTYLHNNLSNGVTYYYKIAAINVVDEGSSTSVFNSTPQPLPESGTIVLTTTYNSYIGSPFNISTPFTSPATITSCQYTINGGTNWTAATVSGTAPNFTCSVSGVTSTEGASLSIGMKATNSGGTNTPSYTSKTVDATIPTITDNWTDSWTITSPITVTLTPSDGSGSGISTTKYCVDTVNTCAPSSGTVGTSVSVTCASGSACTQYVRYATWDNVNNASAISSETVRQDTQLPTATDNWTNNWTLTSPVTVTITPSDASGSGVSTTKYCVDTANTCLPSSGTVGTSASVTCVSGICAQYVRYQVWDVLGNISTVYSKQVRQDKEIPTVTDNWTDVWTPTSPVTITLTPTDGSGSGVATTKYCVDTANTCTPSTGTVGTSVSVTCASGSACTQYVRYAAWDNVNNASAISSKTVRQDLAAPTNPTLTATAGDTQVSLSWTTATDANSGLHTTTPYKVVFATGATAPANCSSGTQIYLSTGSSYIHTGLTNHTQYSYRACAFDNVSNISVGTTASATPYHAYTLTIQPSTKDCYLYQSSPTTNYGVTNNAVGIQSIANSVARGLVSFDFSASVPAGATITTATLSMYAYNVSSGMPIVVNRMLRNDWVENQATWNIYKTSSSWGTVGALNSTSDYTTTNSATANCPASVGWMSWNVKDQVQTARDSVGGVANFLLATSQTTGYVNLYSRKFATTYLRPKLYIEYQY